jgi:hypothetical protein
LTALVAHTGWHGMIDRGSALQKFPLRMPEPTPAFLVSAMRWAMVAIFLAGILWLLSTLSRRMGADRAGGSLRDSEPGA